jgi:transcriptional regulator GlxA family with amidase domain
MMKVGIILFDQVEVLDFAGPYEVFAGAREGEQNLFSVEVVAEKSPVICRGGLQVIPDALFADQPVYDILVVPGGPGTRVAKEKLAPVLAYLGDAAPKAQITAGVCTGTVLMAQAGLLKGKRVTTHHNRREALKEAFPDLTVVNEKVVDCGPIITSAGVSSGIDMALYLVKRLYGSEKAQEVRENIEYGMHI